MTAPGGLGPRRLDWDTAAPADFLEHLHPDTDKDTPDMPAVQNITVTVSVDVTPALSALAMSQLETWRLAQPAADATVDVVTDGDESIVRLYSGRALRSYRGQAPTLYEAAQLALADAAKAAQS